MKPVLYFLGLLLLCSCDPYRRIHIINRGHDPVEVLWVIKPDSISVSPFYISNSTEVHFKLEAVYPRNEVNLSCGLGQWSAHALKEMANDLESLTIISRSDSINLITEESIFSFLQKHRRGISNKKIRIQVK